MNDEFDVKNEYINKLSNTKVSLIPDLVDYDGIVDTHFITNEIRKAVYVGGVIESK